VIDPGRLRPHEHDASLDDLGGRLRFHTALLDRTVAGFRGSDWRACLDRPIPAIWVLGHLAVCRIHQLRLLGCEVAEHAWEAYFVAGSAPARVSYPYPYPELLKAHFRCAGDHLADVVEHLSAEDRRRPWPGLGERSAARPATLSRALAFYGFNEAYQLGQLAYVRALLGKPAAF